MVIVTTVRTLKNRKPWVTSPRSGLANDRRCVTRRPLIGSIPCSHAAFKRDRRPTMTTAIAKRFRRFAGWKPAGTRRCTNVGAWRRVRPGHAGFLAELPAAKQQPNLLLAAVRFVCGTRHDWDDFRSAFGARNRDPRGMLRRRTQTNEPARCAVLLPMLARLPGPLALLEVGASAGLCLLPDRYGYHYEGHVHSDRSPAFPAAPRRDPGSHRGPDRLARRARSQSAGCRRPDAVTWLETLVWPDQPRAARRSPRGDRDRASRPAAHHRRRFTDRAARSCERGAARRDAGGVPHRRSRLYRRPRGARRFRRSVRDLGAVWISNEAPARISRHRRETSRSAAPGAFLLSVNGEPTAWTDPHGAWIDWISP